MNRRDLLIAKLMAKQKVRQAVEAHRMKFAPPQPQQVPQGQPNMEGEPNAPAPNPQQMVQPAPDQPAG